MDGNPRISLVVAAYNRGPEIKRTLDTISVQTRQVDEIILIDDASPDGTGVWVRDNYPVIRVIVNERNRGAAMARNIGAEAAAGELVMFLDHDDELFPCAVETLVRGLSIFPDARASFADHCLTNTVAGTYQATHHYTYGAIAERWQGVRFYRRDGTSRLYRGPFMYRTLLHGNILQQPWMIYRKSFLSIGGFNREPDPLIEDWELYLRVTRAFPVVLTDEVISHHYLFGPNLVLRGNRPEIYLRTLRTHLRWIPWTDLYARLVLHRRIGAYYKNRGDALIKEGAGKAWIFYIRSFFAYPFDCAVVGLLIFSVFFPWVKKHA